jgi:glycosyltransferase involved in cell wall biosynthesis
VPSLSIIIPTYKRPETLKRCLEHLEAQTVRDELEVIVVSDGHDANTSALFDNKSWQIVIHFFEIEKSQQGKARNTGLKNARAPLVLFLGDDIFLAPDSCQKHLEAHLQNADDSTPVAVLGFTTWDPLCGITETMRWLEKSGWQFGYPQIQQYTQKLLPADIQHRFTYTSNISLPRNIAKTHLFREDVSLYGWEDVEWGMRLKKAGVCLYYEPAAKALHFHHMTLEDSLKRTETLGKSIKSFPHLRDRYPRGLKRIAYEVASLLPTMAGKHRRAFLRGMRKVISDQ